MGFLADDRGQAIQIGAILLFGILIIGISIYQATVVPQQNEGIEFEAYQQATEDLLSLRDGVMTAATQDAETGTTVKTGARYPPRTIFVNPPPPTGTIGIESAGNVTLRGVRAIGSEPTNVRAYWTAVGANQQYEAGRVAFTPDYNHFDAPPVVLTGSGTFRTTDGAVIPLTGQTLISGNRITVLTLRGNLSTGGYATSVTADPVSAATRTVTITGDGGTFTLTVPTPGNATAWDERVGQSLVDGNPNVLATTPHANGSATITFDGSRQYELRLAAVELRGESDSSVVADPDPTYLLGVTDNATAYSGKAKTLSVEVRDRYNNPVTGAPVNFSVTAGGGNLSSTVASTDDEGRARVRFTPGDGFTGSATVTAWHDYNQNGTNESYETTTFDMTVLDSDNLGGGGGHEDINPSQSNDLKLEGATESKKDTVEIRFSVANGSRTITHARVSFYYPDQGSSKAATWQLESNQIVDIGDPLTDLNTNVTVSGNNQPVYLTFGGKQVNVDGDFFILSVQFADGTSNTYYVAVEQGDGQP